MSKELVLQRPDLFSPTTLGSIAVANRIVMAPMTRARSTSMGVPSIHAAEYYRQRASAGLIVTESTNISTQARGYAFTPGIYMDEHIVAWRRVTEAVHSAGGRIVLQLWHAGRFSHTSLQENGGSPVAPSAIQANGEIFIETGQIRPSMPRALLLNEIAEIIEDFRRGAANAMAAGFDGVEIHAANSYLLEQFIRDSTNHRSDRYGGSVANRIRLTIEVVQALSEVLPLSKVGVRLSPITTAVGETPLDSNPQNTYGFLASRLGEMGISYLHCIEGQTRSINGAKDFCFDELREKFAGPYVANNGYSYELAQKSIFEQKTNMVAFGRLFISNPDLVERFRKGASLAEATKEAFYGGGETGYTDWAYLNE
jgi:N-ethylmaleimide reductase